MPKCNNEALNHKKIIDIRINRIIADQEKNALKASRLKKRVIILETSYHRTQGVLLAITSGLAIIILKEFIL